MDELGRLSPEEFKSAEKAGICIVLDNVRSAHNVGSVFRSADSFGIEKVILCGITCAPPNRELSKTALGAEDTVPWQHVDNTADAVAQLQSEGYKVVAIEQVEGSVEINNFVLEPGKAYAFILGNEVDGVSEDALELCNSAIEIDQYGTKHSLNVAVTGGIVMWWASNKLRGLKHSVH